MKKNLYIFLVMILGLLLTYLIHVMIEVSYIHYMLSNGLAPKDYSLFGYCILPQSLQLGLILLGLAGGYYVGQRWWQMVYVQKKRWTCENFFCASNKKTKKKK